MKVELGRSWKGLVAGAGLALGLASAWTLHAGPARAGEPSGEAEASIEPKVGDAVVLVFRKGNVVEGTVTSLSKDAVRVKGKVAGIDFETDYARSEILTIKRGKASPAKVEEAAETAMAPGAPSVEAVPADDSGKTRVYWMDLEGTFGEQISETPIRSAMADARKQRADVVIFKIDAEWEVDSIRDIREASNIAAKFDELFRAERMTPIFATEMPAEWEKMPRIVFWVKQAMGGAAFLPIVAKEKYFTSDGRLGGIGNLSTMLRGHERVVEKQISLRLQHAVGWANVGGYPQPELLIRGLAKEETILSVAFENGRPKLVERLPDGPGEELLTDDGAGVNTDTLEDIASGRGNDVLTLNARTARLINFSQGTADSRPELLAALDLDRGSVMVGDRSGKIMQEWGRGLDSAKAKLSETMREYAENQQQPNANNVDEATRWYAGQIRRLETILQTRRKWSEGLERWMAMNGIPPEDWLLTNIEVLKSELRRLRR